MPNQEDNSFETKTSTDKVVSAEEIKYASTSNLKEIRKYVDEFDSKNPRPTYKASDDEGLEKSVKEA